MLVATALRDGGELYVCDLSWIVARSQGLVSHHLRARAQKRWCAPGATARWSSTRSPTPDGCCSTRTSTAPRSTWHDEHAVGFKFRRFAYPRSLSGPAARNATDWSAAPSCWHG